MLLAGAGDTGIRAPWGNTASGRLAAEACELLVGLVEDGVLLLDGHLGWVLVRVAVETAK